MYTSFRPRIRSRHPSHKVLRHTENNLPYMPFRSRIRLGSTTEVNDRFPVVELNSIEAIRNSSSKLRMKQCFTQAGVKTAQWFIYNQQTSEFTDVINEGNVQIEDMPFPIIAKKHFGSRNNGNTKLDTIEQLREYISANDMSRVLFEKYYAYNREYRLHVNSEGCFYTCRKMLKSDAPEEVRWFRNDAHCVWIMEDNPSFDKPVNWQAVVDESVKALQAVGLDFGAVDLRIQSATTGRGTRREEPDFIVVEINSAPSFGDRTTEAYLQEIPEMLRRKREQIN